MGGWAEMYYDAIDHYAWSPERLNHLSNPTHPLGTPRDVLVRLQRLEEPLNHILAIFFDLAPASLVHRIFREFVGASSTGPLELLRRGVSERMGLGNLTQPDLAFDGPESFLTIECKIGSQSSLDQLLKYGALHARAETHVPGRKHALLYVSPRGRKTVFAESFVDWDDLKRQAKEALTVDSKGALRAARGEVRASIPAGLDLMMIGHCTFADLAGVLEQGLTELRSSDDGVTKRLYLGLIREIERRGLRP